MGAEADGAKPTQDRPGQTQPGQPQPGQRGIESLSISISPGEVYGFLGPNGAGKTTTIRLVLGLLHPTSGRAEIFGRDAQADGAHLRTRVGYLPGDLAMYQNYRAGELLGFIGRMRGTSDDPEVRRLASDLGLDLHRHIHDLSRGNRQKVGVIAAFMHKPDLLVLDEPTAGLDPVVQAVFVDMVDAAVSRGAAVFLSSHVLSEVEQMADRVAIVDDGRLIVEERIEKLRQRALRRIDFDFGFPVPSDSFAGCVGVSGVERHGPVFRVTVAGPVTEVLRRAAELGALNVISHEPDLEDIFFDYLRAGPGGGGQVPDQAGALNGSRGRGPGVSRETLLGSADGGRP